MRMRKLSLFGLIAAFVAGAIGFSGVSPALAANEFAFTHLDEIGPGTLVKSRNSRAVYYYAANGKRYVFPNQKTYGTWYGDDFSGVAELTDSDLASLPLGGNVTYRPGTRLLKVPSDPRVYAVSRTGILLPILTESVARNVFGNDWRSLVDDLPEAFFTDYKLGSALTGLHDWYPEAAYAASPSIDSDKRLIAPPSGVIDYVASEGGFSPSDIVVTRETSVMYFVLDDSRPIIASVHRMAGFPSDPVSKGHLFQVEFPGRATYEHYNDRNSREAGTVRVTNGPTINVNQIAVDEDDSSNDDNDNDTDVDLENFYEDTAYNFSVQYPDGWSVSARSVGGVYGVELFKDSAVIGIYPNGGRGGIPEQERFTSATTSLDGFTARRFTWQSSPQRVTTHFTSPRSPWTACDSFPSDDCNRIEITGSTSALSEEIDAIVDSFRFE
jgi:hypothetical protein